MKKASKRDSWKNKPKEIGKEQTQRYHCIGRIKKRLGIRLSDSDYDHIVSCIRNDKESDFFKYKYKCDSSKRTAIYEIQFNGKIPVDVIYDRFRKTIVTVLFQNDTQRIDFYYDIFNNKISLKQEFGYNIGWQIEEEKLLIPSEETVYNFENETWEVVSDGILKGKRFKLDNDVLIEVM